MKRAILFLLFCRLVSPLFADERVTADQLSKAIEASRKESDAKVAAHLAAMELSERLTDAKLAAIEAELPGPESRQAVVMLADLATFLDPPAAEIPQKAAPSFADQRAIVSKTIDYVRRMEERLPNLFAQRETIHFEDQPPGVKLGSVGGFNPAQPLHPVSRTVETVLYRDGKDFIQIGRKEQTPATLTTKGLSSFGEFGPILANVLIDLPQGKLAWSHWEQGPARPVAVFSFSVPKSSSHYAVRFCCVANQIFQQFSAYHGEITVDPENGTVLRIVLMSDLPGDSPITKANTMVEYGPITLGGTTFFCPKKSISLSLVADQAALRGAKTTSGLGVIVMWAAQNLADVPKQVMLNEVHFDQYHLFGSESRVLTAGSSSPTANAATDSGVEAASPEVANKGNPAPANPPAAEAVQSTEIATAPAASEPVSNGALNSPVPARTTSAPEINVTAQKTPVIPDAAAGNEAKFSLRVTTRIVDVSVAAFDKKGRPITNLTRNDFEIFDGARKQTLRSFSRAAAPETSANGAPIAQPVVFSNRAELLDSKSQAAGPPNSGSSTVILFDATSLQFNDLANARERVLNILNTLPPSEPVGFYVRVGFGFRVLLEGTTDRKALAAALKAWRPDARDVARAQEAEERNRQLFDTLQTPGAVYSTYATVGGSSGGSIGSDPRLSNQGQQPTREALSVLVAVAAHMGIIPGHKNLVWIASDNVLVDWSDQSVSGDEGRLSPNSIGQYSIRTQEALNNAQVSLYPFDASQLGTDATDASLENAGVRLDPSQDNSPKGLPTPPGGRSATLLRTQTHTVQKAIQQLAQSTGGQAFGRSGDVMANLNRVIEDSSAVYLLSFAPDTQPDDKYHQLKVTLPGRRDVTLRYRTGYLYSKEPASLKERFAQVLWQPYDASDIAITARRGPATGGSVITLSIAAADIGLAQKNDRWTGKVDVFLVKRDNTGVGAMVKQQTLALNLSQPVYDQLMRDGIPFQQYIDEKQSFESVRLIVVDENSGRMGSLTLPPQK